MHSRIFQISKEPIKKEDYIGESDYYDHWFTSSIADYVNGDTDRESDIEWLKDCYDNSGLSFGADDSGEYFIIADKVKYFAEKFNVFQKTLKELSKITLDGFIRAECSSHMYTLNSTYDDKFGFYIDSDDGGLETLDRCIRYSVNGTKFYIGATIDYHW